MQNSVTLPQWLDNLIYEQLGAKYCRSNADMTVIDWDKNNVLNYLGTYFPRSYAESYCIFSDYLKKHSEQFANKAELSVFDFGSGTGGEIIGLLTVLDELLPSLKKVKIVALDGNHHALRLYEKILCELQNRLKLTIYNRSSAVMIDDFYDLSVLDSVVTDRFDIIMTYKAVCEFVTKQQFELHNPYCHIAKFLIPKLNKKGILLLEDITTKSDVAQKWLPMMMDKGLKEAGCLVAQENEGYNQTYYITHSHKHNDKSNVAWRMIIHE